MAYYRWLDNSAVSVSSLIESLSQHCRDQVNGRHVLAISDTSEINLQAHVGRLNDAEIGVVGNDTDIGFFIHPTLVVDSADGLPLGLSTVQVWTRPVERQRKTKDDYYNRPIEEKESYKWIESAKGSQLCFELGGAQQVTYIGDSESDIYEPWVQIHQSNRHLLIRACQNRVLVNSSQRLFDYLSGQPVSGQYMLAIPADSRSKRTARDATMSVRFTPVTLPCPKRLNGVYPDQVSLYAVEAVEVNPPTGQPPVHWRLLTTHPIETYEHALQMIQWYRWRWHIEQLFAILKQRGLDIEASQQESVLAIQKLCMLALSVAVRLLQLTVGRDHQTASDSIVFNQTQQQCLEQIAPTVNGRTIKQRNPYPLHSLAWAAWIIARLGGWSGYQSQRPPGIVTFARGLQQFEGIFLGWQLAHP